MSAELRTTPGMTTCMRTVFGGILVVLKDEYYYRESYLKAFSETAVLHNLCPRISTNTHSSITLTDLIIQLIKSQAR